MMSANPLAATRAVGPVTILPATVGDASAILQLVSAVGLPREGIEDTLDYFWVARERERERDTIIGSVGLEVYKDQALLRSLAVTPERHHTGLGSAMVATALSYLTSRQFRAVYLLTTTAASFFRRYDFRHVSRADVPASVQQSVEFRSACPDTATCMARTFTYAPTPPNPARVVRPARFADLAVIQEIHNQGIVDRVATLDTEPHTAQETQLWFRQHGPRRPVIVVEIDGVVAGWAALNTFNVRRVYQYVADLSVYIERQWRSKGLGTMLLQALMPLGRALGYHKIVLSAFPLNAPGMQLYQRQGFTTVGIYKEMGWVDGHWVDTIIMEKLL
ncbi:MAG: arsenic resistance N-acetyltransferase ArsN2 [Candidatus Tectomicrobia bacterium]